MPRMDARILTNDWLTLISYLPDLEESARRHGFTRRTTGRQDARSWLRLILMHAAGGLSLAQTVARAAALGWPAVSTVALHKRLRSAGPWLLALTGHLLEKRQPTLGGRALPGGRVLRIVDATDILEPGATGTDWRMHYSLRVPELVCDHFEITDSHSGESLARFKFQPGEVVLVDRGYCHRAAVAQVLDDGADVTLRLVPSNFPLLDGEEAPFHILDHVQDMDVGAIRSWQVWFSHGGWLRPMRLCVLRKPDTATAEARRRMRRKASRNGHQPRESSLAAAAYVMILTSLPESEFTPAAVLELYRCRWQIELAFKRLKSLLQAGHVPKSSDPAAKAWMQAKILTALLIENLLCDSRSFSPWGGRLGFGGRLPLGPV